MAWSVEAIGHVRGGRAETTDDAWGEVACRIELDPARFEPEALLGLDAFSHAEVVFLFDRLDAADLAFGARHPRGRPDWPRVGVFAQRGSGRPNRLGVSVCEVAGVRGLTLEVRGLDAADGTPVVDIKPVMTGFLPRGEVREPAWAREIMSRYLVSPMDDASAVTEADERALLDSIDRWLEKKVAPVAAALEAQDAFPKDLVDDMCEMGLFGALIAPEWGGLGLSALAYSRIVARISEEWMSLTGFFNSHLMMALIVQKFGDDAQKEHWLPKFATGELRGGLALTEPDAGTDLQGIRTTARRDGEVYRINGAKLWITNAIEGDILAVLVKTDPEAQPRHRGMSMLIAPTRDPATGGDAPGVHRGRKLAKLGYLGIDTGEIAFDDYACDAALGLVGGEEGKGFLMATGGLEIGRVNVAARGVGIARRALKEAVAYAQVRRTMGKPIAQHQAIQLKLGEMAAKTRASELLVDDAARAYDCGGRVDLEAGMAKWFATETALEVATEAMRIFGANGYSKDYPIERLYRDAPLLIIGEGTNEMQRIIIARQLIARNPV